MWRTDQSITGRMLPPSLRLLVRHPARSVSLQLQRSLYSTGTGPSKFAHFKHWARINGENLRQKLSQTRSGSLNAQTGSPPKKKRVKKAERPDSSRLKIKKKRSNAQSREERISATVAAVVGKKKRPNPAINGWLGENWKTDDWGLDGTFPVSYILRCRTN